MGSVYHAEHPEIGREVAIKILAEDLVQSGTSAERFLREARSMVRVKHPNVIEVYDFGRTDKGQLYYVMELLVGRDLAQILKSERSLPVAKVGALLEQICPALQAAHEAGVVHRDLKPANIFVLEGEPLRVKILDFGIAKLLEQPEGNSATRTGMLLGTPHYMAPEQAAGEHRRIGPATDIYALGAILYELLSGRLPFDAEMMAVLLAQHIEKPPEPLRSVAPRVPEAVATLVDRCLAKAPEQRPPSAAALLETFSRAVRQAPADPAPAPRGDALPTLFGDAPRPHAATGPGVSDALSATQMEDSPPLTRAATGPGASDALPATQLDAPMPATRTDAPRTVLPATRADAPRTVLPATRADAPTVLPATRADAPRTVLPATRADAPRTDAPRTVLSATRADDAAVPARQHATRDAVPAPPQPGKTKLLVAAIVIALCGVGGGVLLMRMGGKTPADVQPDAGASAATRPDASRHTAAQADASSSAAAPPRHDATQRAKNKDAARSVATTTAPEARTPDAGRRRVKRSPPVKAKRATKPPKKKDDDRAAEEGWVKDDPYD
jgi:serine/threonine-protein kinase